jgi:AraC-like DNA-binding protein
MRAVDSWDELAADPVGHFLAHPRMLVWCSSPDLVGITVRGPLEEGDLAELVSFCERLGPAELDVVFDARQGETSAPLLPGAIRRAVRVGGEPTANLPWRVVDSWDAVGSALGRTDLPPESEITELTAHPGVIARLRNHLAATGLRVSVQEAARALGMASRSLQRHLRNAGSSFREEIERARLDMARRLLSESGLKLETIGHRIGFRSAAHFTVFFGKRAGMTPSAYRRLHAQAPRVEAVA